MITRGTLGGSTPKIHLRELEKQCRFIGMKKIRIASGSGFWGDSPEAPLQQVRGGNINYLILDYLAELTMSILAAQREKNPERGYAHDFVQLACDLAPDIDKSGFKIVTNAGGLNPSGLARAIADELSKLPLSRKLHVAAVQGDNIHKDLDEFQKRGVAFDNLDSGEKLSSLGCPLITANAYLGCDGILQALEHGADIIVTGRVADASLALAPMRYEFGWKKEDWNLLAQGMVAGHVIECGAQASGGNASFDWENIEDLAHVGFPIIEASEDGSMIITKHEGTGGAVTVETVKEQLVYEIGDPKNYLTPDVIVDFTTITVNQVAKDRVAIIGATGKPPTEFYKVSASYPSGFKAEGTMLYAWPQAYKKASVASEIIFSKMKDLGIVFEDTLVEFIGATACHGSRTEVNLEELPEVQMRVAVRAKNKADVERFGREIAPLVLGGPPGATGYASGRPKAQQVYAYWPTLIPREYIQPHVRYF